VRMIFRRQVTLAKRILVVEDDSDIMLAVAQALEEEGYEVAAALDVSIAKLLIQNEMPDVAIIDHQLPDGTGDEICRMITSSGKTPVIMFTGEAQEGTVLECLDSGATDYVLKGTGIEELVVRVAKHAA
jgi:DNA-binding response OmpR family regulator